MEGQGWATHPPTTEPCPCPPGGEAWSSPEAWLSCLLDGVPEETGLDREGEVRPSSTHFSQLLFIQLLPEVGALPLTLTATPPGTHYHPHHVPHGAASPGRGPLRPAPPPDAEGTCAQPSPHPGSHRGRPAAAVTWQGRGGGAWGWAPRSRGVGRRGSPLGGGRRRDCSRGPS